MPINIDEFTTEVIAEPEASGGEERRPRWEEILRLRSTLGELEQDRRRLAAEDAHE
jgi:hypothetical protein